MESERLETEINGGLVLSEYRSGIRFGTDALLLASFARERVKRGVCADFGTGSGVLPLLLLAGGSGRILSVGGGLPLREENRALLHELGQVFYLRAGAQTIYERLKHDTTRPLLQGEDPQGKIARLLGEREKCYMDAADVVIDVDGKDFETILGEIEERAVI